MCTFCGLSLLHVWSQIDEASADLIIGYFILIHNLDHEYIIAFRVEHITLIPGGFSLIHLGGGFLLLLPKLEDDIGVLQ